MTKSIVSLADLTPDPENARSHSAENIGMIEHALTDVGAARSIVIDENGIVLAGNATIDAATRSGLQKVQVVDADGDTIIAVRRTGLTSEQKKRLAIYDNRAAELATWNPDVLTGLAADDTAIRGLFSDEEWVALQIDSQTTEDLGNSDEDFDLTSGEGETRCQLGDLWLIGGKHRLLIGDCTNIANIERLVDGIGSNRRKCIQGCFTSPPYADQRKNQYGGISGDKYVAWFGSVQSCISSVLSSTGSLFINIKEHSEDTIRSIYVHELVVSLVTQHHWVYIDEFCWERVGIPGDPMKMGKFKNQWEPIFWFAKTNRPKFNPQNVMHESDSVPLNDHFRPSLSILQGTGESVLGSDRRVGKGRAYPGNRIRGGNNDLARQHPVAFPVSLPSFFIKAYSDVDDIWIDPFLGSGTTMVAAHQLHRVCYGCELEPRYGDIILRRMENLGLESECIS